MKRILGILVTVISIGLCPFLRADVLRFDNGDQITGTYIGREDGMIIFLSPVLGELRVPVDVATVRMPVPSQPSEVEAPVAATPPAPPSPPVADRVDLSVKRPRFPEWNDFWEDNAVFRWMAYAYPLMTWKNRIELGLDMSFAQADTRALLARFRTERTLGRTSYLFESSYERTQLSQTNAAGITTTTVTRNRIQGRGRIRRDIQKDNQYFIESSSRYNRDIVTRIYHEAEQTFGVGYRWLDTGRWKSSVVGSAGASYREINTVPGRVGFVSTFFHDIRYQLTDRITISEETNLSYVPTQEDENAYMLRTRAQLETRLNAQLSLNLRYDYYFDERIADPAARTTQGVTISLGAEF